MGLDYSTMFEQADSLNIEEDKKDPKIIAEKARLDSTIKAEALEAISQGIDLNISNAQKSKLADIHEVNKAKHFEQNEESYQARAAEAVTNYYNIKNNTNVDEIELDYEALKFANTASDPESGQSIYALANYDVYANSDANWVALKKKITPTGVNVWNPFWSPNERDLEKFQKKDLLVRQEFLEQNQKMDNMYDALISPDGTPTEEFNELILARQEALDAVTDYNMNAQAGETFDLTEVAVEDVAGRIKGNVDGLNDLHKSENLDLLIDEIREVEFQARKSRVPVSSAAILGGMGITGGSPTMPGYPNLMAGDFAGLEAEVSFKAAHDLDPNLFNTHAGLYDAGWEELGAESGWLDANITNPEEVKALLLERGIDPALFGFLDTETPPPTPSLPQTPSSEPPPSEEELKKLIEAERNRVTWSLTHQRRPGEPDSVSGDAWTEWYRSHLLNQ